MSADRVLLGKSRFLQFHPLLTKILNSIFVDGRMLACRLIQAFLSHNAVGLLLSRHELGTPLGDISKLILAIEFDQCDINSLARLCQAVSRKNKDINMFALYVLIDQILKIGPSSTTPPSVSLYQSFVLTTANCFNNVSFQNTSDPVSKVREELRWELHSSLELSHRNFMDTFFAKNQHVEHAASTLL